jgi:hypothetical protein
MIRNVNDVSALLNRRFGGAVARPWSIVRTLAWVLVGLYVLGLVYPARPTVTSQTYYNKKLVGTSTVDQMLDKNDPRGFVKPVKDPKDFTIAWIGTSTMQNVGPGHYSFVPADVRKMLPEINGKPVRVQMYLLEGGRLMDLYNTVSRAIATKPDMIMLDLNPLWLFNDSQTEEWTNLTGAVFADMVGQPASWPYLAAFDSPSDMALAVAGAHLSVINDRWSYAESLREDLDRWSPINPAKPSTKRPTGTALIASMTSPLDFWETFRPIIALGSPNEKLQEQILKNAVTNGSNLSDGIMNAMFDALAGSKIPTVAYVPAIDPGALKDPGVNEALTRIEDRVAVIANSHQASTFLVKPQSAIRTVTGIKFKDIAHMTYDAPMVSYLANLVCAQDHHVNPNAQCTPTQTASK